MPLNLSKLHRHKVHFEETVPEIPEIPTPLVEEETQPEPINAAAEEPILFNGRDEDFQSDEESEEQSPEADEEEEEDTDKIIEELVSMRVKKEVAKMKAELQKTKPQATEAKAEGQEQSSFFGTAAKMLAIPAAMMFAGPLINMGAKALTVQALKTTFPMPPPIPGMPPMPMPQTMSSENPGQPIMPSFAMPTHPSLRHPEQYAGFLRT